MHTGTIKWFKNGSGPGKGFGFINPSDECRRDLRLDISKDVFVHIKKFRGVKPQSILKGDEVQFNVITSQSGLRAIDVAITAHAPSAISEPVHHLHD